MECAGPKPACSGCPDEEPRLAGPIPGSRPSIVPAKADDLDGDRTASETGPQTFIEEHKP